MKNATSSNFYERFITNNLDPRSDQIKIQRIKTFNIVGFMLVFLAFFWASTNFFLYDDYTTGVIETIGGLVGLVFIALYRFSKNVPLMLNIGYALATLVVFSVMIPNGVDSVEVLWTYLLPPFAFFLTGVQGGIIWTMIIFLNLSLLALYNQFGFYSNPVRESFILNLLLSHMIVSFFSYQYERARLQAVYGLTTKNKELQRLIYTVSHDLKTPIVSLIGYLSFVREEIDSGETEQRDSDLDKMAQICNNMRQMINDLLNLSRIRRQGQFSHISTSDTVVKLLSENESQLRAGAIETAINGTFPTIFSEERKFEEILRNLLSNAIKYIGNPAQPKIEVGVTDKGQYYEFFVRDNGIGIDQEEQEAIFNPFYAKSDVTKGSGIGLSIAKGFAEDIGGKIWVASDKGQGSTFYFTVPKKAPVTEEPGSDLPANRNPNENKS